MIIMPERGMLGKHYYDDNELKVKSYTLKNKPKLTVKLSKYLLSLNKHNNLTSTQLIA